MKTHRQLGSVMLLAPFLTAMAQEQTAGRFEIDLVFPRADVYTISEVFPIAFAVQNLTTLRNLTDHYLKWSIMPYRQRGGAGAYDQPTGNVVDSGVFSLPEDDEVDRDDSYIFVAHSNVTEWLAERRQRTGGDKDEKYMLQWVISESTTYKKRCGGGALIWRPQHLFGLEAPGDSDSIYFKPETDKGVAPDVTEVPECPVFGAVIDILPNATDSTCIVLSDKIDETGTPCAIKIDEAAAQQIATRVSELADAAQATRAPESDNAEEPEDDKGAGSSLSASITGLSFAAALVCLGVLF